jgi:hypothetical protein
VGNSKKNKKCVGFVFEQKDVFSISVDFDERDAEGSEATVPVVSEVVLWFMPAANPYFDPQGMRPIFVKLIGEPDASTDIDDRWGDAEFSGGIPKLWGFVHGRTFMVVLSAGHQCETSLSGLEPRLLREARR